MAIVFAFVKPDQVVGRDKESYGEIYERLFASKDLQKFSRETAKFVVVFSPSEDDTPVSDGTSTAKASQDDADWRDSVIPQKLDEVDDYFTHFNAKVGQVVVTDAWGENVKSFAAAPNENTLRNTVNAIKKRGERTAKSVESKFKGVIRAQKTEERERVVRALTKVFDLGVRGFEETEKAVEIYEDLLKDAERDMRRAIKRSKVDVLETLAKDFRGTGFGERAKKSLEELKAKLEAEKEADEKEASEDVSK